MTPTLAALIEAARALAKGEGNRDTLQIELEETVALYDTEVSESERRTAGFDVGNGMFRAGDRCHVATNPDMGIGRIISVYQDGEVDVEWRLIANVKWRYILPPAPSPEKGEPG